MAIVGHRAADILAEEFDDRRNPFTNRGVCNVGCRLDADSRYSPADEMLQQIPIVARDFDHMAITTQPETIYHGLRVQAGVLDPAIRERRKVWVVAKNVLRTHIGFKLDEIAFAADADVERIEWLHLVETLGRDVTFAQRGHAEVHHRVSQGRAAESANRPGDSRTAWHESLQYNKCGRNLRP